ncbi:putative small auxin-up RNA [Helianthus annuus]|uniref:Putative SAUR-like auxin-responsive protein family n=1 Tax=Helianthus annuus TaxID=4232 RepID=A0A251RR54_HELAN|nr:putative small auxin-up RNA [Helianthus annuus]KAJ0429443.1 putative small auxin-up RNA [Helianthus annuus]KAJ0433770.1 putative small auxin-up RNA [Helianthus annuus]KAJ0636581.1 putative small auxin-up RNA [Helianthus annuus]KAJ0667899.1 putative small auxin-up RNA [Helianthus annuus]
MGIFKFTRILHAMQIFRRMLSSSTHKADVPKGCFVIYVGENKNKKRFVVPLSYLKHPWFLNLLMRAEEEYGFDHHMEGLMIPCREDSFQTIRKRNIVRK